MMKKILITTTDTLYGWEIEAYLKPIFASVVIGTNMLADISASFSDLFGGRSSSYEKRLQLIKDNAIAILSNKALELGANCILNLEVDVDQISGKNMQMFMITAGGTAVIAKNNKSQVDLKHVKEVDKDLVKERANIIRLVKKYHNVDTAISIEEVRMIADSQSSDFRELILHKLKSATTGVIDGEVIKLYKEYFSKIEPKDAIEVLYPPLLVETTDGFKKTVVEIIKENDLLDFGFVYLLLENSLEQKKIALNVLLAHKPVYGYNDVQSLEEVIEYLKSSFAKLSIATTKKGFLSSAEKEVWTCRCGSTNAAENRYCGRCYNDEYGFSNDELKPASVIEILSNRLLALKGLL